jgi:uncharacterized protein (TIGR02996 family)
MSDEAEFLATILESPDEDAPRLVFADWLDEHGQSARAEFIRTQVGLARLFDDAGRRAALVARQQQLLGRGRANRWFGPAVGHREYRRGLARLTVPASAVRKMDRPVGVEAVRVTGTSAAVILAVRSPKLAGIPELTLAGSGLDDDALEAVAPKLGAVVRLDLSGTAVTDDGIDTLAACPALGRLRHLHLRGTRVTDRGVRALLNGRLGSHLHTLDLAGTTLNKRTAQAVMAFHSARPADPRRETNALGMELALIPAGRFRMGSTRSEEAHETCEGPRHDVTISRPFYLGTCPVTQAQFEAVMGRNPSHFDSYRTPHAGSPGHPVEQVTWYDAVEFCNRLSSLPQERAAGLSYRLPTEAEWEYACRAGTTTPFSFGATLTDADANCDATSAYGAARSGRFPDHTTPVGSYPANPWGLCDMHGNVYEWCSDWFRSTYYRRSPKTDPLGPETGEQQASSSPKREDPPGPESGEQRVIRGGSWLIYPRYCRSALRNDWEPNLSDTNANNHMIGFRVAADRR